MKTKKQLFSLFLSLTTAKSKGGAKFKYNTLKNIKVIESEIDALRTIETETADILKPYIEAKNAVIEKYGKEVNGVPMVQPTDENYKVALAEIKALDTQFSAEIELHTAKVKEYDELTNSETDTEYQFMEIQPEVLPDDITDVEMEQLMLWEIVK